MKDFLSNTYVWILTIIATIIPTVAITRSARRRQNAEAKKAEMEADKEELDFNDKVIKIKDEILDGLREDFLDMMAQNDNLKKDNILKNRIIAEKNAEIDRKEDVIRDLSSKLADVTKRLTTIESQLNIEPCSVSSCKTRKK